LKKLLIASISLITLSIPTFSQTHSGAVSIGYGFPSILGFVRDFEKRLDIDNFDPLGIGPFHGKAEYIYRRKVGLSVNTFYNTLRFNINNSNTMDTFLYRARDFSMLARVNYYFKNTEKQQLYFGIGIGKLNFNNYIIRITSPNDTFLKIVPVLSLSNNTVMEATFGYRRQVLKNWYAYGEVGFGRVIMQFAEKGAIDSYLQLGATYCINNRKKIKKQTIDKPVASN
jgi:hypothetical protein